MPHHLPTTSPTFPPPPAARHYDSGLSLWLSVDPMADKYPGVSPYVYCGNNPVRLVDEDGEEWVDINGNRITDHSKIKVYIFYDPNAFDSQSKAMAKAVIKKYGASSVALSIATTKTEFAQDWKDMASRSIKEVDLNYHGDNQTLILSRSKNEYITSTGNGMTNVSGTKAMNVQDLPKPLGCISNAQLNINSCKSNSMTQYPLKGSKLTLMAAFYKTFSFMRVRGTSAGVSYSRFTQSPKPQWFWQSWDYLPNKSQPTFNYGNALYYKGGGHW